MAGDCHIDAGGTYIRLGQCQTNAQVRYGNRKEFRSSKSELQALHHDALLKDLGLVLSPSDMVEQRVVTTTEEAKAIRARFKNFMEKLSIIPFLSQALFFVMYRYERYNGKSGSVGARDDSIPAGS